MIVLSTRNHGGESSSCKRSLEDSGDSVIAMTVWEHTVMAHKVAFEELQYGVAVNGEAPVLSETEEVFRAD